MSWTHHSQNIYCDIGLSFLSLERKEEDQKKVNEMCINRETHYVWVMEMVSPAELVLFGLAAGTHSLSVWKSLASSGSDQQGNSLLFPAVSEPSE